MLPKGAAAAFANGEKLTLFRNAGGQAGPLAMTRDAIESDPDQHRNRDLLADATLDA